MHPDTPPVTRCPLCRRPKVKVTKDGYLYAHNRFQLSGRCSGSGMSVTVVPHANS